MTLSSKNPAEFNRCSKITDYKYKCQCWRQAADGKKFCQHHLNLASKHNHSKSGKAIKKKFRNSIKGKEEQKRNNQTSSGKARAKRYAKSPLGKSTRQKAVSRRKCVSKTDYGYKLACLLTQKASAISSGKNSPSFVDATSFESAQQFRKHMSSFFNSTNGFLWSNYATKWVNEHRIPKQAYDHKNPIDVKRCWSSQNMRPLSPLENNTKSWKIVDSECHAVGIEHWPLSWNGSIPSSLEKEKLYAEWKLRFKHLADKPV